MKKGSFCGGRNCKPPLAIDQHISLAVVGAKAPSGISSKAILVVPYVALFRVWSYRSCFETIFAVVGVGQE